MTLKDLLQMANDSSANNVGVKGTGGNVPTDDGANVSEDFQLKQIDRLVEAIALTLPNGGVNQGALALNSLQGVGTQSTSNLVASPDMNNNTSSQPQIGQGTQGGGQNANGPRSHFRHDTIKDLANDMGFNQKLFFTQLQSIFQFKL